MRLVLVGVPLRQERRRGPRLAGVLLDQSFNLPTLGTLALSVVLNVGIGMPALMLIDKLAGRRPRQAGHARGR